MTPEERAAIEARDERSYWASEKFYTGVEWRVITDRHALLDELRRVERWRDGAVALVKLLIFDGEGILSPHAMMQADALLAEIDGEKEKSGGARQD